MKLSDKFANLGPSGIARQLAPKGGDAPATRAPRNDKPPVVSAEPAAGGKAGRDQRAKAETPRPRAQSPSVSLDTKLLAKPKFDRTAYQRDYMREYMRKWRAKTKEAGP